MAKSDIDVRLRLKGGSQFQREMGQAASAGEKFGQRMQGVGRKLRTIGAGMTAGFTAPLVYGIKRAVDKTESLNNASRGLTNSLGVARGEAFGLASVLQVGGTS